MTIAEAAAVLGVAPATLRTQVRLGKLRAARMGKTGPLFVSASEVERYSRESLRKGKTA